LSEHKQEILRSAGLISTLTILSRILGYVRDQRIALLLGTTLSGDAFVLAYRIPNLLRRLVAEGSMTAAFVPVFAGYLKEKDRNDLWDFANRMFWTLSVILAGLAVGGVIFSPLIIKLFTLNHSRIPLDLAVSLNRLMFPYIFFIGMSALAMGILNSFRIFGVSAFAPVLLNLSIVGMSFFARRFTEPAYALALGVLIGGAMQLGIQLPWVWKQGMRFTFGVSFSHPGIRQVAKLMVPGIVGIGVAQINFFVDTVFATRAFLPVGSLVSLQFADRVMELVLGGYAIAVGTAILPMMSRHAVENNIEELKRTLAFSLRIVSFITVPAMVGLILMRRPIVEVLFQHGRFNAASTDLTAWALWLYALGLPWFAISKILVPAFYSTQDMRTPVKVAALCMVTNIVLNLMLLQPLLNGGPALSTSLAGVLNSLILYKLFVNRHGDIGWKHLSGALGRILVASAGMGTTVWVALQVASFSPSHSLWWRAMLLAFLLLLATGVYFGLAWLLHCEELSDIYGIARRSKKSVEPVAVG
jgi:putative peptidoglycan lipid II flippase